MHATTVFLGEWYLKRLRFGAVWGPIALVGYRYGRDSELVARSAKRNLSPERWRKNELESGQFRAALVLIETVRGAAQMKLGSSNAKEAKRGVESGRIRGQKGNLCPEDWAACCFVEGKRNLFLLVRFRNTRVWTFFCKRYVHSGPPSRFHESFGRRAVEAIALGVPTVCFLSGTLHEIVVHEETGLACDESVAFLGAELNRFLTEITS
jgi:hypothetical protein